MPYPPTKDAPVPASSLHMSLHLSWKALWPHPQPGGLPSLTTFSLFQGRHPLKSSYVLLRLSFSMSQFGHQLYLCAGGLCRCRGLGDKAMVRTDLQGATVLQGMVPFCSQNSRRRIRLSDIAAGETTWQEEDMQPVGTNDAKSSFSAAGSPKHPLDSPQALY